MAGAAQHFESAARTSTSGLARAEAWKDAGVALRACRRVGDAMASARNARTAIETEHAPYAAYLRAEIAVLTGNCLADQGRWPEADRELAKAASEFTRLKKWIEAAQATLGRARVLAERGEKAASITLLEELREMQLPAPLASQVFNNLGLLYKSEGRLREAREVLEQDIVLCRRAEDASGEAIALLNAAGVIALQHENAQALEYAGRAASLFARVGAPDGRERAKAFANQLQGPLK